MRALVPGPADDDLIDRLYVDVPRDTGTGRPWVLANMVTGLDGAAAVEGRSAPLSGPCDREVFHRLRSVADVVLVGATTARVERYGPHRPSGALRAARLGRGQRETAPVAVVSGSLHLDWASPLFAEAEARTIVVTSAAADEQARAQAAAVADVVVAGEQRVDPAVAVAELGRRCGPVVLTEGGPSLLGALLAADLVDELCLTLAPVTGGDPLPLAGGGGPLRRFRRASACAAAEGHLLLRELRDRGPGEEPDLAW